MSFLASLSARAEQLIVAGRFSDARDLLLSGPALNVDAKALYLLAVADSGLGDFQGALDALSRLLALEPTHSEGNYVSASILTRLGRHQQALGFHDVAVTHAASNPWVYVNRGVSRAALGRLTDAIDDFDSAILLDPSLSAAFLNKGNALFELELYEESLMALCRALDLDPSNYEIYSSRSACLTKLSQPSDALIDSERALSLARDSGTAWTNRGNALRELGRLDDALACYDRAIHLEPRNTKFLINRGVLLNDLRRHEEAFECYLKAIEVSPNDVDAHWNLALDHLRIGNFGIGWRLYEWRWKLPSFRSRDRGFLVPLWLGQTSLDNKAILLHSEQGLGDAIQFCRYARTIKEFWSARVVLEIEPALYELFLSLEGVDQLVLMAHELPLVDYHCPLLSLPLALEARLSSIPQSRTYLNVDTEGNFPLARRICLDSRKPKVGLVWSGNRHHKNDRHRSLPLMSLINLVTDDYDFFCLQKEVSQEERETLDLYGIHDLSYLLTDLSTTAFCLKKLDLLISVDTCVAHLGGAIGKATWVLLPYLPDFRWMWDLETSPWYPSLKLFRQERPTDWSTPLAKISSELRVFLRTS